MTDLTFPNHVAVIMDGNGRWAAKRGLPRSAGHKRGVDTAREITKHAQQKGVTHLTLFGFSTENWSRPKSEIQDLMGFLRHFFQSEIDNLHQSNIRIQVIGYRHRFDTDIVEMMEQGEALTENNTGMVLTLALDYGGRQEIVEAVRDITKQGIPADQITQETISAHMMSAKNPDPDLIIRTSGEHRVSNFLIWSGAYAELYFSPVLWPDFKPGDLDQAMADYAARERRFGQTGDQMRAMGAG